MAHREAHPQAGGQREMHQHFEVQRFLGKGSYGAVYKVRRKSDGATYALKETNVRHMSQAERIEAVNEVRLLAGVAHEHICEYYESFVDNNKLCIVMEYCPCGDLSRYVRRRKQQARPLAENTIWSYFMQMAMAVQHLHKAKVLHRDVKLANVMRKTAEVVKLGDLGVARLLKGRLATTQIGTPHYMPPEVWKNRPYSFSSDAWALGVCLYEMCTFGVPFEARSLPELRQKVMRASYAPISSSYSSDLSRVIRALLDPEPSTRPTVADVLRMSCIRRRAHLLPGAREAEEPATPRSCISAVSHAQSNANHPLNSKGMCSTIKVPRNLRLLSKRLPASRYPTDAASECDADSTAGGSVAASESALPMSSLDGADSGGRKHGHDRGKRQSKPSGARSEGGSPARERGGVRLPALRGAAGAIEVRCDPRARPAAHARADPAVLAAQRLVALRARWAQQKPNLANGANGAAGRKPSEFLRGREFSRANSRAASVASDALSDGPARPAWRGGGGQLLPRVEAAADRWRERLRARIGAREHDARHRNEGEIRYGDAARWQRLPPVAEHGSRQPVRAQGGGSRPVDKHAHQRAAWSKAVGVGRSNEGEIRYGDAGRWRGLAPVAEHGGEQQVREKGGAVQRAHRHAHQHAAWSNVAGVGESKMAKMAALEYCDFSPPEDQFGASYGRMGRNKRVGAMPPGSAAHRMERASVVPSARQQMHGRQRRALPRAVVVGGERQPWA